MAKVKKRITRKRTSRSKRSRQRKPTVISIRRSSGRTEKFDVDKMTITASRSGVPFLMARDISKNVSKEIKKGAKRKTKTIVTSGRVKRMIARELRRRNKHVIASSYAREMTKNSYGRDVLKPNPRDFPMANPLEDSYIAYRAERGRVLHDRSKRPSSA